MITMKKDIIFAKTFSTRRFRVAHILSLLNIAVSSAKITIPSDVESHKSFTYDRKNNEPSTDPCCTPQFVFLISLPYLTI